MPPQPLDPDIVNLAKAVKDVESSGNIHAVGASGEYGAYQWLPGTWDAQSKAAGINVPLKESTNAQQNQVWYTWAKSMKDKGYGPAQIASMQNAGEGAPDAYLQNYSGTNKEGVSYNTPQYVQNVIQKYRQYKSQGQQSGGISADALGGDSQGVSANVLSGDTGNPFEQYANGVGSTPTSTDSSLGSELQGRLGDAASALSNAAGGKISPLSGLLQAVGAGAGAVGDVVNKGLELIPGVKQVENLVGQGIGKLASTPAGQAVAKEIQIFSNDHPELANDIGAGFNIITAIPIFRGLAVLKDAAGDAVSQGLKGVAEKSFVNGAPDLFTSKTAKNFVERNPTVFQDMVDRRLVGDIQDGKYVAKDAANQSWRTITKTNGEVNDILAGSQYAGSVDGKNIAQNAINGYTNRSGQVIEGIPNANISPEELITNAKKLDPNNAKLWDKFLNGDSSLQETNKLRAALDRKVKKAYLGKVNLDSPEISISKERGALLAGAMRDTVQSTAQETQPLFDEMEKQFAIQRALEFMNGKEVKPGTVAKLAGHAVGIGTGGFIGNMIGGSTGAFLGGLAGDRAAGAVAQKLAGRNIVQGILKRTGENAIRTPRKEILKKVGGLVSATEAQKATR